VTGETPTWDEDGKRTSASPVTHGLYGSKPIPAEALLAEDYELQLAWAPLTEPGTSCRYGACEDDEHCTCENDD
jgi:hypothetical protein